MVSKKGGWTAETGQRLQKVRLHGESISDCRSAIRFSVADEIEKLGRRNRQDRSAMPNFHDCALGLCSNAISSRIGRTAAIRSSDYRAASTKMIQPVTVRPESSVLGSAITHFSICFAWGG